MNASESLVIAKLLNYGREIDPATAKAYELGLEATDFEAAQEAVRRMLKVNWNYPPGPGQVNEVVGQIRKERTGFRGLPEPESTPEQRKKNLQMLRELSNRI